MDHKSAILEALRQMNRDKCIDLSLNVIEKNIYTIPELYENILKAGLYYIDESNEDDYIWIEHSYTSIVRSVIECMHPQVIKLKERAKPVNKKAVLACPENEYHEIGLRMIDDYFNILGYESIFIGANTPKKQIFNAVFRMKADYLALSVTDYYLLFEAQKIINRIKEVNKHIKIIVGGIAFKDNIDSISTIGGDIYIENFKDFENFRDGEWNEIIF